MPQNKKAAQRTLHIELFTFDGTNDSSSASIGLWHGIASLADSDYEIEPVEFLHTKEMIYQTEVFERRTCIYFVHTYVYAVSALHCNMVTALMPSIYT